MRHRVELFRKIIRMIYEMLFVVLLTIFFENVVLKSQPGITNRLILVVLFFASLWVRNIAKIRLSVLCWHIVFGMIVYRLPIDMVSRVMLIVIVFYLMSSSMSYLGGGSKLKPLDDAPWPSFFIMLILYLFGVYTKSYIFINSTYVVAVLMLVTYYLMTYLEGLKSYIDSTKDVQGLPLSKVVARNNIMVFSIIGLLIILMIIGFMLDYSQLIQWIKEVGRATLNLIVSVFMIMSIVLKRLLGKSPRETMSFSVEESQQLGGYAEDVGNSFVILLYVAIALIALVILIKIVKYVLKLLFAKNKHENDLVEVAESREDIVVHRIRKKGLFNRLSEEEKLRKKYKRHIEKYRYDIRLSDIKTCRDIASDIESQDLGDVSEITELYASVRYGNAQVDKKMTRRVNSLIRK